MLCNEQTLGHSALTTRVLSPRQNLLRLWEIAQGIVFFVLSRLF